MPVPGHWALRGMCIVARFARDQDRSIEIVCSVHNSSIVNITRKFDKMQKQVGKMKVGLVITMM